MQDSNVSDTKSMRQSAGVLTLLLLLGLFKSAPSVAEPASLSGTPGMNPGAAAYPLIRALKVLPGVFAFPSHRWRMPRIQEPHHPAIPAGGHHFPPSQLPAPGPPTHAVPAPEEPAHTKPAREPQAPESYVLNRIIALVLWVASLFGLRWLLRRFTEKGYKSAPVQTPRAPEPRRVEPVSAPAAPASPEGTVYDPPEPLGASQEEVSTPEYVVGRVGNFAQRNGQPYKALGVFSSPSAPQITPVIWSFIVTEEYQGKTVSHSVQMQGQNFVGVTQDGRLVKFARKNVRGLTVKLTEIYDVRSQTRVYAEQ
jgi:hypothetical protein